MARNVLIVDDASFIRVILKGMLQAQGFVVVGEAANGVDAVVLYRQLRPDLVIMDITMPEMDGIEAILHIKQYHGQAKIIVCSVLGYQDVISRSIKAGALDYVVKPIKEDRLFAAIQKIL